MVEKLDGGSPKPSEGLPEWDVTKPGFSSVKNRGKVVSPFRSNLFASQAKPKGIPSGRLCADAVGFSAPQAKPEKTGGGKTRRIFSSKGAKKVTAIVAVCLVLVYAVAFATLFSSRLEEKELTAAFASRLEEKEWTHVGSSGGDDVIAVLDFSDGMLSFDVEIPSFNISDENVAVGSYRVLDPGTVEISVHDACREVRISFEDDAMIVEPAITSSASSEVWV